MLCPLSGAALRFRGAIAVKTTAQLAESRLRRGSGRLHEARRGPCRRTQPPHPVSGWGVCVRLLGRLVHCVGPSVRRAACQARDRSSSAPGASRADRCPSRSGLVGLDAETGFVVDMRAGCGCHPICETPSARRSLSSRKVPAWWRRVDRAAELSLHREASPFVRRANAHSRQPHRRLSPPNSRGARRATRGGTAPGCGSSRRAPPARG